MEKQMIFFEAWNTNVYKENFVETKRQLLQRVLTFHHLEQARTIMLPQEHCSPNLNFVFDHVHKRFLQDVTSPRKVLHHQPTLLFAFVSYNVKNVSFYDQTIDLKPRKSFNWRLYVYLKRSRAIFVHRTKITGITGYLS